MDSVKVKDAAAGEEIAIFDTGEVTLSLAKIYGQYNRLMPGLATMAVIRTGVVVADIDPVDLDFLWVFAGNPTWQQSYDDIRAGILGFGPGASQISVFVKHSNASGTATIIPILFDLDGDGSAIPVSVLAPQTSTAGPILGNSLYFSSFLSWDIPAGKGVAFLISAITGTANAVSLFAGVNDQTDNLEMIGWQNKTDETFWENGMNFSWTGSGWFTDTTDAVVFLRPVGGWEVSYRPTRIRFELTANSEVPDYFYVTNGAGNLLYQTGLPVQGTEYVLTDNGFDMDTFGIHYTWSGAFPSMLFTKIEFLTKP